MTLVISRLQHTLFNQSLGLDDLNPLNWKLSFTERIQALDNDVNDPHFYRRMVSSHLVLNMEYSLLGQQIRANLTSKTFSDAKLITEQLISALLLAELLEHLYRHYLCAPREVKRFREQQQLYRQILEELQHPVPAAAVKNAPVEEGLLSSQKVRTATITINLFRLMFIRSKRALDLIAVLDVSSESYRHAMSTLDKYTAPLLFLLPCFYFLPRLSVNLALTFLHTVPGPWMTDKKKRSLGWSTRFGAQMQRRWFELGNDLVWVPIGFINCFVLVGALAPFATYLAIVFFGYDVIMSATRAYIEISRLYDLRKQYVAIAGEAKNQGKELEGLLKVINKQIEFEILRLGSHVMTTSGIFLAMCCSAPFLAMNPIIPLIGALCLVLICLINFALASSIRNNRPKDIVEIPALGISKLSFFARRDESPAPPPPSEPDIEPSSGCCIN